MNMVSGTFADVAYVGAVEATYFYDLVRAARVHRLPEKLMTSSRTAPYFAQGDYPHAAKLISGGKADDKSAVGLLPSPTVTAAHASTNRFAGDGSHSISFIEVQRVTDRLPDMHDVVVDCDGLQEMWRVTLAALTQGNTSVTFAIYNVDMLVSSCSQLMLSLFLLSFARLARHCESRNYRIALCMTVSATHVGRRVADMLQAHIEKAFSFAVERVENITVQSIELHEAVTVHCASQEEWLETVQQWVVDRFEEECEAGHDENMEDTLRAAVILVVLSQHDRVLRAALRRILGDAYTSEPMHLVEDTQWRSGDFEEHACVVFLCSDEWLRQQAEQPRHARLVQRMRVRHVLQSCGGDDEDEVRHLLYLLCPASRDATTLCASYAHEGGTVEHVRDDGDVMREECMIALLLLFRRFLLRYAADTGQPLMTLSRSMLPSEVVWRAMVTIISRMRDAGLLRTTSDASNNADETSDTTTLELTALGRFASYRFRLCAADALGSEASQRRQPHLSLMQSKLVLFAHLFRLPRSVVLDMLVQASASTCRLTQSRSTMQRALDAFITMHHMYSNDDVVKYTPSQLEVYSKVVRQLAAFGLIDSTVSSSERIHYLLSAPHGVRTRVMRHDDMPRSTRCRGWYDAAPSTDELAEEQQPVTVYCLPPLHEYCEIVVSATCTKSVLQCPLELSIPLLILHSILHITAHNNCVLLEATTNGDEEESVSTMQLPLQLLQSSLFETLLSGGSGAQREGSSNVGLWLDACMQRQPSLAPSDASLYAPLTYAQERLNGLCERGAVTARKRRRVDNVDAANDAAASFTGVRPRTTVEADAIDEFVRLVQSIGRERAERAFLGKKGFRFLDVGHELHAFYLHSLQQSR